MATRSSTEARMGILNMICRSKQPSQNGRVLPRTALLLESPHSRFSRSHSKGQWYDAIYLRIKLCIYIDTNSCMYDQRRHPSRCVDCGQGIKCLSTWPAALTDIQEEGSDEGSRQLSQAVNTAPMLREAREWYGRRCDPVPNA